MFVHTPRCSLMDFLKFFGTNSEWQSLTSFPKRFCWPFTWNKLRRYRSDVETLCPSRDSDGFCRVWTLLGPSRLHLRVYRHTPRSRWSRTASSLRTWLPQRFCRNNPPTWMCDLFQSTAEQFSWWDTSPSCEKNLLKWCFKFWLVEPPNSFLMCFSFGIGNFQSVILCKHPEDEALDPLSP